MDMSKVSVQVCGGADWITPELAHWLVDVGIPRKNVAYVGHCSRDQVAPYNGMIANAMKVRKEFCLFIDRDMRPELHEVAPLFESPLDFRCVRYSTECGDASWRDPESFHTGMWMTSTKCLRALPAKGPWFGWPYNENHSHIRGCVCQVFKAMVKKCGFSIGYAGYCGHDPGPARAEKPIKVFK